MAGITQENHELLTPFAIDELQYSSLSKLLNVTAYVQKYIDKINKKQSSFGNLKRNKYKRQKNYGSRMFNKNTLSSKKDSKIVNWIQKFMSIALSVSMEG